MASEVAEVVVPTSVGQLNDPAVVVVGDAASSFHGLSINNDPITTTTTTPAGINGNVANGDEAGGGGSYDEQQQQLNGVGVNPTAGPSTSAPVPVPVAPPTYDDIFPALPCGNNVNGPASAMTNSNVSAASMLAGGGGGSRPKLRSSNVTKIYRVAPDERRYRDYARRGGDDGLNRICAEIMHKTETEIQLTSSKDGTLSFLISGKDEATSQARRMISSEFQAQIQFQLSIPKEHHRIILGKGGKKLTDLEQATGTKIQIPKQDENSESIRITGTKESIDKAVHEIQLTSNEAASRSIDRVNIPKQFHPFIVGPFGEMLNRITAETGAKVNVPPQSVNKDEISITGERNNVKAAKERVLAIYQEKERCCQSVSIEVKKAQHKYIVGPRGHTLNEIFELTGVAVEMPSPDSPSETIVLRGEQDKLANALAVLYQKAHSETEEELEVPGWIQRHILGPKGTKFQELSLDFPKVNVSFEMEENLIKMSGAVADVKRARELIKQRADEISSLMVIEEIKVADSKHIKFVVGKNGANLKQIRDETKATIQVISNDATDGGSGSKTTSSNASTAGVQFIRIEGTQESVAKAKQELLSLLNKLENEMTYELPIERRFYGQIIGAKGENIRDIRNKFNQVMITFPEQNGTSEKVIIRGNKKDAEQCYKYLSQLNQELLNNNYRLEVPIFTQLLQFIQRKDSIKKIREETGTRIDLPTSTEHTTDLIVITGSKEKVEKALDRIQALQSSLSDMSHVDILVPAKIHNYMLGSKGRNIKQIMSECGGVIINFPPEGSGSDKVQIRGPKDCVQKAKQMLMAMSNDYQTNNYSEELKVKVEHHRYLIGKNGSNINKLRDQTGVRVYFASDNGSGPSMSGRSENRDDPERVVVTGKKESVQKAVVILQEKILELEKIVEDEMRIDPKYHSLFVARRAAVCKQLYEDYGGVNVSFPHSSDKLNDRIVLKGSKECVEQVKTRILEIIADHDAQVSVNCIIDASHHRHLLGPRSGRVQGLQHEFDVKIKFPARPKPDQNGGGSIDQESGGEPAEPKPANNIVVITGRKENCEKASEALLALVPITDTIDIPYEYHRFVIGQKGAEVRELMDRFNVQIRIPPSADKSDEISVIGTKESVEAALDALKEKLQKLEGDKADREARNYQLTFKVEPVYHPKIIGKRGAVISSIRSKFDVQIQVPESGKGQTETSDQITVIGYEKNAMKAKEHILQIVKTLEDQTTEELLIDSKIHSRLIGTRGKNIRRIMDQFKVDIRFPRNGDANPDLVTITGAAEDVESAKEHLLETSESYLDDIEVQYQPPQDHGFQINFEELSSSAVVKESPKGFQVRGGPWEKKSETGGGQKYSSVHLDVSSAQDFPAFGPGSTGASGDNAAAVAPISAASAITAAAVVNNNNISNDQVVNGTDSSGLPATGYGQPNAWGRRK